MSEIGLIVDVICTCCGAFKDGEGDWDESESIKPIAAEQVRRRATGKNPVHEGTCPKCNGFPNEMCGFSGHTKLLSV